MANSTTEYQWNEAGYQSASSGDPSHSSNFSLNDILSEPSLSVNFLEFMKYSKIRSNGLDDPALIQCFLKYHKEEEEELETSASGDCKIMFDSISCWPRTPPDTLRIIPCFEELNGLKYNSSCE